MDQREPQHRGGLAGQGRPSTVGTLVYLLLGPILWALHFTALYGVQSVACAIGAAPATAAIFSIEALILLVTLIGAAPLVLAMARPDRAARILGAGPCQSATYDRIMVGLGLLSLFGIVAEAATAFLIPVCGALR